MRSDTPLVRAGQRDADLDFVKGFLVIGMALYHAMNHVPDVPAALFGYLRFVNGSFVFISGYLIASLNRHIGERERVAAARRLAYRGAKLLLLFTALNLLLGLLGATNYRHVTFQTADIFRHAADIYFSGDATQIAFKILVPISGVFMLAGIYLVFMRYQALLAALTVVVAGLYTVAATHVAPHPFFLLTGLVGIVAGLFVSRMPRARLRKWPLIIIGFVLLASAMNELSGNVMAYCAGIALVLKLIYDGARMLHPDGAVHRTGELLGQYSLICYIAQISLLFLLHRLPVWRGLSPAADVGLSFISVSALLIGMCALLATWRRRSVLVEKTYRLVFA